MSHGDSLENVVSWNQVCGALLLMSEKWLSQTSFVSLLLARLSEPTQQMML